LELTHLILSNGSLIEINEVLNNKTIQSED
jgi:hypothetical protein